MISRSQILKIFLFPLALLLISCGKQAFETDDLIPVVNLITGETDSVLISDLFYAENYDLNFIENNNIIADYNKKTGMLYLTPQINFSGMTLLEFELNGGEFAIPIYSKKLARVGFSFKPGKNYKLITLFGSFNSWNRNELIMKDENGDGIFEITIPLEPGRYEYKFYVDGEEIVDPENPVFVSNGMGSFNSIVEVEKSNDDNSFLHVANYSHGRGKVKFNFVYQRDGNSQPISLQNIIALIDNKKINVEDIEIDGANISVTMDKWSLSGEDVLRLAVSSNGVSTNMQMVFLQDGEPKNIDSEFSWQDGVIYSLLIDRFKYGDASLNKPIEHDSLFYQANYNGGDLQGVIDKINEGYFSELGVNTIWISPLYDNPNEAFQEYPAQHRWYSGYHGYWPIAQNKVEEHFGTMDKVKELVKTAHGRGIKVLLDFVSNHVHEQHNYYLEHKDWFGKLELPDGRLNLRFWDEYRLTTWFEPYLPSFDYNNSPEAVEAVTNDALWWLNETGADGYRHDAVKHVPNVFWRSLTKKLKKNIEIPEARKVFQVGETFGGYDLVSSYVNNGQLNSQFNFNLYNKAQVAFIDPDESFKILDDDMKRTFSVYGPIHLMGNIMDSHDKNRYMAYTDGDLELSQWSAIEEGWNNPPRVDHKSSYKKAELYLAYMNAIPGLPVIYYGSEFGMTGASDPDNRRMMRFGDELNENEKEMLENAKQIINLRGKHTALRYGDFYTLKADKKIYAFVRSDFNERLLVVVNKSENPKQVEIQLPKFYSATKITDVRNNEDYKISEGSVSFKIDAIGWKIFRIE